MKKQRSRKASTKGTITKAYIKSEFNKLATKTDLGLKGLEVQIDIKMDDLERRIDERAREYRDDVLTKLDGVMGELQTRREEDAIGTNQISELREQVDDHEVRITALEK